MAPLDSLQSRAIQPSPHKPNLKRLAKVACGIDAQVLTTVCLASGCVKLMAKATICTRGYIYRHVSSAR